LSINGTTGTPRDWVVFLKRISADDADTVRMLSTQSIKALFSKAETTRASMADASGRVLKGWSGGWRRGEVGMSVFPVLQVMVMFSPELLMDKSSNEVEEVW